MRTVHSVVSKRVSGRQHLSSPFVESTLPSHRCLHLPSLTCPPYSHANFQNPLQGAASSASLSPKPSCTAVSTYLATTPSPTGPIRQPEQPHRVHSGAVHQCNTVGAPPSPFCGL